MFRRPREPARAALRAPRRPNPPPPARVHRSRVPRFDFSSGRTSPSPTASAPATTGSSRFSAAAPRGRADRGGLAGTGYNVYDRSRKVWHQTCGGREAQPAQLEGPSPAGDDPRGRDRGLGRGPARAADHLGADRAWPGAPTLETSLMADHLTVAFDGRYRKR
jgi:hypothetical protein